MSESIQDRIAAIATSMYGGDPTPAEIRGYEVTLAGLLWQVNREVTQAEMEFRVATLGASTHTKSAAAARMVAEAGPTYGRLLTAKAVHDSLMEMLRTCRSSARSLSEEMRMQR